jgi:hypothetical protein
MHVSVAAEKMVGEDYWGAMVEFESILAEYPLDPYSLHMAYFLALTIGNSQPECHLMTCAGKLVYVVRFVERCWDLLGQGSPLFSDFQCPK